MKNFKKAFLTLAIAYSSCTLMAVWPFQQRETSYPGESYYHRDGIVGGTVETGVTAPFDILSGRGDQIGRTRERRDERFNDNRYDYEYSRKKMRHNELERLERRTREEERELKRLRKDIERLERNRSRQ